MTWTRLALVGAVAYFLGMGTLAALHQAYPITDFCPSAVVIRAGAST